MMCLEMERLREKQAERDELQALIDSFLSGGGQVKTGIDECKVMTWEGGINQANKELRPLGYFIAKGWLNKADLMMLATRQDFPQCWLHQGEKKYLIPEVDKYVRAYCNQKRRLK